MKPALLPEAVAQRLSCSKRTVLRLIAKGELVAFKVARDWRIDEDAVDAYRRKTTHIPPRPALVASAPLKVRYGTSHPMDRRPGANYFR